MREVFTLSTPPPDWADPIFTHTQAQALLAQPHHVLLHNGGHVLAKLIPATVGDILTLYVPPPLRRQGLAKLLVQEVVALASQAGCTGVAFEVRADNTPARALYESLGFAVVSTRKGYYGATDGLVMQRVLG